MNKAENSDIQVNGFSWIRSKIIINHFKNHCDYMKTIYEKDTGLKFGFLAFVEIEAKKIEKARQKLNTYAWRISGQVLTEDEFKLYHNKYYQGIRYSLLFRTIEGKLVAMMEHPELFGLTKGDYSRFFKSEFDYASEKYYGMLDYATHSLDWRAGAALPEDFWDHIPDNITIDEFKPILEKQIKLVQQLRADELLLDSPFDIERQKFVNNLQSAQTSLFDDPVIASDRNLSQTFKEHNIQIRGLTPSHRESQLIHGVLKIMHSIGIEGNDKNAYVKDDWIGFEGNIPSYRFTKKDLTEYGLNETYGAKESNQALNDLEKLCNKMWLFVEPKKKGEKNVTTERLDRLFELKKEYSHDENGKRRLILLSIRPSAHFYKYLKMGNVVKKRFNRSFKEIGREYRQQAKYFMLFEDYLDFKGQIEGSKGKDIVTFEMNYKEMAAKLQMDVAIRARQWSRIRERLDKIYAKAKELGWIIDYQIDQIGTTKSVDIITFKPHVVKEKKKKASA